MQLLDDKHLLHWLQVNNQPCYYMHNAWWSHLGLNRLSEIYQSYGNMRLSINRQVSHDLQLPTLPFLMLPVAENDQLCPDTAFWINYFFGLRSLSILVSLLLLENPETAMMQGVYYRQLPPEYPVDKIRYLLSNYLFVAGPVRTFLSCNVESLEIFGSDVLMKSISSELASRFKLLFEPSVTEKETELQLRDDHKLHIKQMIKRLIKLFYSTRNTTGAGV